ncbi:MAG: hypothetical protein EOO03_05805, partial [Chitinophagaceae bacterium]
MKKIFTPFLLIICSVVSAQNVGIGTTDPKAKLHVADSAVLFSKTGLPNFSTPALPPVEGAGSRFMWYPDKAALRAGYIDGTQWNRDSIGYYSTVYGVNSKAKGDVAFAMGENANASGRHAFAFGYAANAAGNHSTAFGSSNNSLAHWSVTLGTSNTASGSSAIAMGNYATAKANGGVAIGMLNDDTDNPLPTSSPTDRVFQVGIGGPMIAMKKNAMTVLRNGKVGIGTLQPAALLHVADSSVLFSGNYTGTNYGPVPASGTGTRMMWYPDKAAFRAGYVNTNAWDKDSIGDFSFASGMSTKASGQGATALGYLSVASGGSSFASGSRAHAAGIFSTAMGNYALASGAYAASIGYKSEARANASFSIGNNLLALSDASIVLGNYNDTSATNRIFEIGNGTSANRKNAVTILQTGNMGIGPSSPLAKLHVDSSVLFTGNTSLPATPANTPLSGAGVRMMWYPDKAAFRVGSVSSTQWDKDNIGNYSFAAGRNSTASGGESVALGSGNIAAGNLSFSAGNNSQAMGAGDVAIGSGAIANGFGAYSLGYQTLCNGTIAYAFGQNTVSSGWASTSMGAFTKAKSYYSLVIGQYNDTTASNSLFEIGNGTTDNNRRNAMTVLANGNVGIGTKSPVKPLSFPATLGEKILLYPGGSGEVGIGVYGNELRLHADNPGAAVSFGTQDNAGNFTQAGRFQVNGAYALSVNGSIWANGTTYASDARFKKNVVTIPDALEKVMQLNGVNYEMKTEAFAQRNFDKGKQVGLLAQDVEKVVPEV